MGDDENNRSGLSEQGLREEILQRGDGNLNKKLEEYSRFFPENSNFIKFSQKFKSFRFLQKFDFFQFFKKLDFLRFPPKIRFVRKSRSFLIQKSILFDHPKFLRVRAIESHLSRSIASSSPLETGYLFTFILEREDPRDPVAFYLPFSLYHSTIHDDKA